MSTLPIREKIISLLIDPWQMRPKNHGHLACPICGFVGHFWSYNQPPTRYVLCPACGSKDRDRLLHFYINQDGRNKLAGKTVLHFAPEACGRLSIKDTAAYITADLHMRDVDLKIDITAINLPSESIDVVICSHVLEHVDDDSAALRELWRILRHGGMALLMVPICDGYEQTYENRNITMPAERKRHFGQWDHVRYYGADFPRRIARAGFTVSTFSTNPRTELAHGLRRGERVFIAAKA